MMWLLVIAFFAVVGVVVEGYNNCIPFRSSSNRVAQYHQCIPVNMQESRRGIHASYPHNSLHTSVSKLRLAGTTAPSNAENKPKSLAGVLKSWAILVKDKVANIFSALFALLKAPFQLLFGPPKSNAGSDSVQNRIEVVAESKILNFPSLKKVPDEPTQKLEIARTNAPINATAEAATAAANAALAAERVKEGRRYVENVLKEIDSKIAVSKALQDQANAEPGRWPPIMTTPPPRTARDAVFSTVAKPLNDRETASAISVATTDNKSRQPAEGTLQMKKKKSLLSLTEQDLRGKRVLVRCDFNVPLQSNYGDHSAGSSAISNILDDTRIRASLPTIDYLRQRGAKILLASHLGRPRGTGYESGLSLQPVATRLTELLQKPVALVSDCVGLPVAAAVDKMQEGDVVLLENLRFHSEEVSYDSPSTASESFARALVQHIDLYVNDAFGTSHRNHTSLVVAPTYAPSAVSGLLLSKELSYLHDALLVHAQRPLGAIIGGSKVSTKLSVLEHLLQVQQVDSLVIAGAMAFAFLQARGISVGDSLVVDGEGNEGTREVELARQIEEVAKQRKVRLILAEDVHVLRSDLRSKNHKESSEKNNDVNKDESQLLDQERSRIVDVTQIPTGWTALDIGPRSIDTILDALSSCQTILWNGPLGVYEDSRFATGTRAIAQALASWTSGDKAQSTDDGVHKSVITIVGGGDTVAALQGMGLVNRMSHVSTGGGAMWGLLEGRVLPAVAALDDDDDEKVGAQE